MQQRCFGRCLGTITVVIGLLISACSPNAPPITVDQVNMLVPTTPTPQHTCGIDSLYLCSKIILNDLPDLKSLDEEFTVTKDGVSAAAIQRAAERRGLKVEAIRTNLANLKWRRSPAILHINPSHFIALLPNEGGRLKIFDNRVGLFLCTNDYFEERYDWDGIALVFGESPPLLSRLQWLLEWPAVIILTAVLCAVTYAIPGGLIPLSARVGDSAPGR